MAASVCGIALVVASQNPSFGGKPAEEEKPVGEEVAPAKPAKAAAPSVEKEADDYYGGEEVNFTFGEPMTSTDPYGDAADEESYDPAPAPAAVKPAKKINNQMANGDEGIKRPAYRKPPEPGLM